MKQELFELTNAFLHITDFDPKRFYMVERCIDPLTEEPMLRIYYKTPVLKRMIIWFYTRHERMNATNEIVSRADYKNYWIYNLDVKTHDEQVMSIHLLYELGLRHQQIAKIIGTSAPTVSRRNNEFDKTPGFTGSMYERFKKQTLGRFRR